MEGKPQWTEFERYVVEKLDKVDEKIHGVDIKLSRLGTVVAGISTVIGASFHVVFDFFKKKL